MRYLPMTKDDRRALLEFMGYHWAVLNMRYGQAILRDCNEDGVAEIHRRGTRPSKRNTYKVCVWPDTSQKNKEIQLGIAGWQDALEMVEKYILANRKPT